MDTDMERRLNKSIAQLKGPARRSPSTEHTYHEALKYRWKPYAAVHGLPADFSDSSGVRPLSEAEIEDMLLAAQSGELRRGTHEGNRTDRLNTPLSPASLDILVCALRRAHQRAGIAWAGDSPGIRELRTAYARRHAKPVSHAAPIRGEHLESLFVAAPRTASSGQIDARCRAITLALRLSLRAATRITPDAVTWDADRAQVDLGDVVSVANCIRGRLRDVLAVTVCGHCQLGEWLRTAEPGEPLLESSAIYGLRSRCLKLASLLPRLDFDHDMLSVQDEDLWTTAAVGLTPEGAAWLLARAMLLPMMATGLRLLDFDQLPTQHVVFGEGSTIIRAHARGSNTRPTEVTLEATGGALCPVTALAHYDGWVSAYLPDRPCFIVPTRGTLLHVPVELEVAPPVGSRPLDQRLRGWLKKQDIGVGDAVPGQRRSFTPQSTRRGFAAQAQQEGHGVTEIQRALRHVRVNTTEALIRRSEPPVAPAQVHRQIAQHCDD